MAEKALGAAVLHAHRPPETQCQQTRVHLQADVLARSERPADSTEHETHLLLRQPEARGDLAAVLVHPLRRHVQLDSPPVVIGNCQGRFQTEERLVLHPDVVRALDGDVARCVGVAVHDALMTQQVAVRMDPHAGAGDRRFRVEQRLEHLELDGDRGHGPSAGFRVVGGHGGDRFTDVADDVAGKHRLVGDDQPVGLRSGHVGGGQHGVHPGDRQRR